MKKTGLVFTLLFAGVVLMQPAVATAYNFGDYRSETLVTKAWGALSQGDIEAVLAYTNKCLELYSEQARKMQKSMDGYAEGSNDKIFSYWALNDIATALFIQGEAYRQADMKDEAKEVYSIIIDDYFYGQTWDPKGWFWKPADAAKEKVEMIVSGINLDFGDYTSSYITTQAWKSLTAEDYDTTIAYTSKVIGLYESKAQTMQESMTEYAWESK